jgi:hypothetical protein
LLLLLLLLLFMAVFHTADDDYLQTDRYHVNLSHHNRRTTVACVQNMNCTLNTSCNFKTLQNTCWLPKFYWQFHKIQKNVGYWGKTRTCFGLRPVITAKYLFVSFRVSCSDTTRIYRHYFLPKRQESKVQRLEGKSACYRISLRMSADNRR